MGVFFLIRPIRGSVWSPQRSLINEADEFSCPHCSFLNDLDRVTGYNYVPTDGARHHV